MPLDAVAADGDQGVSREHPRNRIEPAAVGNA